MRTVSLLCVSFCLALACGSTSPPPTATEPSATSETATEATPSEPAPPPGPVGAARPPDDPKYFAYAGYPKSMRADSGCTVLINAGYVSCYSESRKTPLWVAYRVFAVEAEPKARPRPSRFRVDDRTDAKVTHDDYTNTGYDRGHMAPYYAIDTRYGEEAGRETFLMSNIALQNPKLNQGLWRALEMKVAKEMAQELEEVWVITGPVFKYDYLQPLVDVAPKLDSGVAVPEEFFKIVLDELPDGSLLAKAVMIPQEATKDDQKQYMGDYGHTAPDSIPGYDVWRVPVATIEKATGLHLFHELDRDTKSGIALPYWYIHPPPPPTNDGAAP